MQVSETLPRGNNAISLRLISSSLYSFMFSFSFLFFFLFFCVEEGGGIMSVAEIGLL